MQTLQNMDVTEWDGAARKASQFVILFKNHMKNSFCRIE